MFDMVLNTPLRLWKTLKSIWNKWIPKCWKKLCILQCEPCRGYPYEGISKDIRSGTWRQSFVKISQNSQECIWARVSFQPTTFNFIEKETPAYIAPVSFTKFFRNTFIMETSCELNLKREFYKKWRTTFLIYIARKVYIWQPFKESWHWT